jgi:Flp pilus assembly protein TadD
MAATLPAAILLHDLLLVRGGWRTLRARLPHYALLGATAAAWLGVRISVLGALGPAPSQQITEAFAHVARPVAAVSSLAGYLLRIPIPIALRVDYPALADGSIQGLPGAWASVAIVLVFVAAVGLALRRWPEMAFLLLFFLVSVLPVSHLVPLGAFAAERFAYLPSAPLLAALALGVEQAALRYGDRAALLRRPRVLPACIALATVALATGTWRRNEVWGDAERFWDTAARDVPASHKAYVNLGRLRHDRGDLDGAETAYRRALEIRPGLVEALSNLAGVLAERREYAEAEALYRQALASSNGAASKLHYNLARLLLREGRNEEAEHELGAALRASPYLPEAARVLAESLAASGRTAEALDLLSTEQASHPDLAELPYARGQLLRRLGRLAEAGDAYREAVERDPEHLGANLNLAATLAAQDELLEAQAILLRLEQDHPERPEIRANLGRIERRLADQATERP